MIHSGKTQEYRQSQDGCRWAKTVIFYYYKVVALLLSCSLGSDACVVSRSFGRRRTARVGLDYPVSGISTMLIVHQFSAERCVQPSTTQCQPLSGPSHHGPNVCIPWSPSRRRTWGGQWGGHLPTTYTDGDRFSTSQSILGQLFLKPELCVGAVALPPLGMEYCQQRRCGLVRVYRSVNE